MPPKVIDKLEDILNRDLIYALGRAQRQTRYAAFWKRVALQLAVSSFDAVAAGLRSKTLDIARKDRVKVDPGEMAILCQKTYALDDKGKPRERNAMSPMESLVKFSFSTFDKIHGLQAQPDFSASGWECVTKTIKSRNRIIHPKRREDLEVSSEEIEVAMEAAVWIHKTYCGFLQELNERYKRQYRALRQLGRRKPPSVAR